jgi:hypothetical protein
MPWPLGPIQLLHNNPDSIEPEPDQALLLQMLNLSLPSQPPPRIMPDDTPISQ